LFIIIYIIAN